jgi:formamidopyrimidine-DNA glycosylase
MPELPEVETTVNELRPGVTCRRITGVEVLSLNSVAAPAPAEFKAGLTGRTITSLSRRGKHLVFGLDDGRFLIAHLRMTGALLLKPAAEEPEKYVRVIIYLDDGQAMHFRDVRRFGRMWLVEEAVEITGKLGPEPLSAGFTPEVLGQLLKNRTTPVKSLLLDQTLIAGIGNMYADEALYRAGIHPLQPGRSLKKSEIKKLYEAIQQVLSLGIRYCGASTDTFIRPAGIKGEAHLQFQVAHQKGRECAVCGETILRTTVQQRGSFFCPHCQPLHEENI